MTLRSEACMLCNDDRGVRAAYVPCRKMLMGGVPLRASAVVYRANAAPLISIGTRRAGEGFGRII